MAKLPGIDQVVGQPLPTPKPSGEVATYQATSGQEGARAAALQGAGQDLTQAGVMIQAGVDKYDEIAAENAITKLTDQRLTLEAEAKKVRGEEAAKPDFLTTNQQKFVDTSKAISEGLTNENQKRLFGQRAQVAGLQFKASVLNHQAGEMDAFAKNTATGMINSGIQAAGMYAEPSPYNNQQVAIQLDRAYAGAVQLGAAHGMGPNSDFVKLEQARIRDEVMSTRILTVAQTDPLQAKVMFNETKDALSPKARLAVESHITPMANNWIAKTEGQNVVKDALKSASEDFAKQDVPTNPVSPAQTGIMDLRQTAPVDQSTWDKRADGSSKGNGFLGLLKTPSGKVASEYSVGIEINGKEMDIPTFVPTLTRAEVQENIKNADQGKMPSDAIMKKAEAWAKQRIAAGKPVFAQPGEESDIRPGFTFKAPPLVEKWAPQIEAAGKSYGVDPNILKAQATQESGGNPNAVSNKGAEGFSQFIPGTAERYKVNVKDPASSIDGQGRYMRDLLAQFGGDYEKALAAYNMGEGNARDNNGVTGLVNRWGGDWLSHAPKETQNYVASIKAAVGGAGFKGVGQAPGSLDRKTDLAARTDQVRLAAEKKAEALFPGNPNMRDSMVAEALGGWAKVVAGQAALENNNSQIALNAVMGGSPDGTGDPSKLPTTWSDLRSDPKVAQALDQMPAQSRLHIATLLAANAATVQGKITKVDGAVYMDVLNKVQSGQITENYQLTPYLANGLGIQHRQDFEKMIADRRGGKDVLQGEVVELAGAVKQQWMKNPLISYNPQLASQVNDSLMAWHQSVQKDIAAANAIPDPAKRATTIRELFDPNSKTFVGGAYAQRFIPKSAELAKGLPQAAQIQTADQVAKLPAPPAGLDEAGMQSWVEKLPPGTPFQVNGQPFVRRGVLNRNPPRGQDKPRAPQG